MCEKSDMNCSKIPIPSPAPLRRSGSLRLKTCPPIQEHSNNNNRPKLNRHHSLQSLNRAPLVCAERDDDLDSVKSFSSSASVCSTLSQCEHSTFARNGTTYSGRCNRYVVHCSPHTSDTDEYLTPTQRTNRTIRKLKALLREAQVQLIEKDKEIARLTKEVVELRLLKADESSPDEDKATKAVPETPDTGPVTRVRENHFTSSPLAHPRLCATPPLTQSLSDSGHFEDLNSSKESSHHVSHLTLQRQHDDEVRDLKEKHNDKVESLLQRITDVNDRYYALRPLYEECKERLHQMEKTNEDLKNNSSCKDHYAKILDLENANKDLTKEKLKIASELAVLQKTICDLTSISSSYDELKREYEELRLTKEKLEQVKTETTLMNGCQKENCGTDKNTQTEKSEVDQSEASGVNNHMSEESSCLSREVEVRTEELKLLEQQNSIDKLDQAAIPDDCKEMNGVGPENHDVKKDVDIIPELLRKLEIKQDELDNLKSRLSEQKKERSNQDAEMTLQFLKSAIYYFLTDRENAVGHLSAIESILGFSDLEKSNIDRAYLWR